LSHRVIEPLKNKKQIAAGFSMTRWLDDPMTRFEKEE